LYFFPLPQGQGSFRPTLIRGSSDAGTKAGESLSSPFIAENEGSGNALIGPDFSGLPQ
jgi:hypothetical protein